MKSDNDASEILDGCSWRRSDELIELDMLLKNYLTNPREQPKEMWLRSLLKGLGVSYAGLAEKLNVSRQAVDQLCDREETGRMTMAALRSAASALECEFVYAFVPKNHESFSDLVAAKTVPLVIDSKLRKNLSVKREATRNRMIIGARVAKYLSRPTGRWRIWGFKKAAARRNYKWFWQD